MKPGRNDVLLDIPLGGGLRQEISEDLVQPPFVTEIQNCTFTKEGKLTKAPGAEALSPAITIGPAPNGLSTDGRQLVLNREDGTYAYSEVADAFIHTHERAVRPARAYTEPFASGVESPGALFCDMAVLDDVECLVWQSAGIAYYMLREVDTRGVLLQPTPIPVTVSGTPDPNVPRPRVIAHTGDGCFLIAFKATTAAVTLLTIDPTDGSVIDDDKLTFTTGGLRDLEYEEAEDTRVWVCIESTASTTTKLHAVTVSSGAITIGSAISISQGCTAAQILLANNAIYAALSVPSSRQTTVHLSTDFATIATSITFTADWTPSSFVTPTAHLRCALSRHNEFGDIVVWWSLWGAPPGLSTGVRGSVEHRILDSALNDISSTDPVPDVLRNYVIASRGFRGTGRGAMVAIAYAYEGASNAPFTTGVTTALAHEHHTLQDHALVVELTSYTSADPETGEVLTAEGYAVIARLNHDQQYSLNRMLVMGGSSTVADQHYTGRWTLDGGRGSWRWATSRAVDRTGGLYGVSRVNVEWKDQTPIQTRGDAILRYAGTPQRYVGATAWLDLEPPPLGSAIHGGAIHWHGGYHAAYDGAQAAESTPFYSPERPQLSWDATSGDGKAYRFKTVYRWTDARGVDHRSSPSPASAPVNKGNGTQVTVRFPMPPPTALSIAVGRRMLVDVYQTDDLSTGAAEVYYLRETIAASESADPHLGTTSYANLDTNNWTQGRTLYTDGGILPGEAPPALLDVVAYGERLAGISADDPRQIWITKPGEPGVASEWSPNSVLHLTGADAVGATALGVVDDKLVIFEKNRVVYTYGDGPDATGAGRFAPPIELTRQVGCSARETVAHTPLGILFYGPEGYWIVSRELSVKPIGAPVEDSLDSAAPIWAAAVTSLKQIRIALAGGEWLVWDWERQLWSRWTSRNGVHGIEADGRFYRVTTTCALRRETPDGFEDPDGSNLQAWTSAWVRLENLQGFQRVRRIQLGAHDMPEGDVKISVGHNGDAAFSQAKTWTAAQLAALPRAALEIHVQRQKCQSVRVRVEEPAGNTGAGFAFSRLTLLGEPLRRTFRHLPDGAKK